MTHAALAILGPLTAAAAILIFRGGAALLALLGSAAGLAGALVALFGVAGGARYAAGLPGLPGLPLRLVAGPLTATLSAVVAAAGFLILVYAVGYMAGEADKPRFFAGMSFFVAAMQTLALAGDWVLLLASWELISLSSYLLIGFWFDREGIPSAATHAFLYTRAADLGLYVAIFVLISQTGTSEISRTYDIGGTAAVVAGLLLLVAAAGKSAQVPLQGWLQDAMVGPTPVSALLHSATLVAAGTILMIRVTPLLPPVVQLIVGLLGGLTALVTGLIATSQRDLKRLLAASTSSQYGLMLLAVGAGAPVAAAFHLVAHAAMKSSLFLGAGVFQHARGSTAFAYLSGVGRERRLAFLGFVVAGLALAGVPPLSGFFSKDAVIAASFESPYATFLAPLALAGALLTAIYVARALRLLWRGGGERGEPVAGMRWMGASLAVLVALAAALGFAGEPLARLVGGEIPDGLVAAALGLTLALGGLLVGWFVPAGRLLGPLRVPAERGFRVGSGFDGLVARPALAVARSADLFDRGIHAGVLGVGTAALAVARASRLTDEAGIDHIIAALVRRTRDLGARARELQTGLVHRELLLAAAGAALILVFLAFAAAGL
jgi:NADH-quinone oxidoreductase subunit L